MHICITHANDIHEFTKRNAFHHRYQQPKVMHSVEIMLAYAVTKNGYTKQDDLIVFLQVHDIIKMRS